eukprot:scaffold41762_cov69-Phaeocystis_antarctica.AAC.2
MAAHPELDHLAGHARLARAGRALHEREALRERGVHRPLLARVELECRQHGARRLHRLGWREAGVDAGELLDLLGALRALAPAHAGHHDGEEGRHHPALLAQQRDRVHLVGVRDREVVLALHASCGHRLVQLEVEQRGHAGEVLVHALVVEGADLAPDLLELAQLLRLHALHDEETHDPSVVVDLEPAVVRHLLEHPQRLPRRLRHAELQQTDAHLRVRRALPPHQLLKVADRRLDVAGLDLGPQHGLEHRHRHPRHRLLALLGWRARDAAAGEATQERRRHAGPGSTMAAACVRQRG